MLTLALLSENGPDKHACIFLLVDPDVDSSPFDLILVELAFVRGAIRKGHLALAVRVTVLQLSFIYALISEGDF